ncbi:S9 family peptidase [Bacteroidota bacterium]
MYILNLSTGGKTFLETDTIHRINHGTDYTGVGAPAVWSKDGQFIYYLSDKNSEFQQIYEYDVVNKKNSLLINEVNGDIVDLNITANKQKIVYKTNEDGYFKLYSYYIANKNSTQLKLPQGSPATLVIHPIKNTIAVSLQQTAFQEQIITYNLDNDEMEYWFKKETFVPKTEQISYLSYDSINGKPLSIFAWKFKPENGNQQKYPVLIDLHGGPVHQSPNTFWDPYKGLLDLGIVIISPNFRGSLGYGKSFELADNGYNRLNPVNDIGALLNWIEKQPDLDASRVGVIGSSYGGCLVLSALTKYSDRLICGIDAFGISNISTQLKNSEVYAQDARRSEFGDERIPHMQKYLDSISPLNNANKITVPLYVFQGMKDRNVSPSESEQIVVAVNANGNKVWYIVADNEAHGLRNPLNMLYVISSNYQFVKKHLLKE